MKNTKIILIDDQSIIKKAIREFLKKEKDIHVIAEARNYAEGIVKISALKPDLIVTDLSMPDIDGFEVTRLILEEHPRAKVLLLSSFQQDAYLNKARDIGAYGYILKDSITDQLVEAIHFIAEGKKYFNGITR